MGLYHTPVSQVNVQTGKSGWLKRVNRQLKSVTREATLTDQFDLDPSRDAVGKIHAAAKSAVLKRKHVVAKDISKDVHLASLSLGHAAAAAPSMAAESDIAVDDNGNEDSDANMAASSDDEPVATGFLSNLKIFMPTGSQSSGAKAKAAASPAPASTSRPKAAAKAKATAKAKVAVKPLPSVAPKVSLMNSGLCLPTSTDVSRFF